MKMTTSVRRGGLGLAAALMTTAAAVIPALADTYKWITFKPQGAADAQAVSTQWLVDEFEKRTGGKHKIQVFWGGSVAKAGEIPDALAAEVGDFGDIITPYFPDRFPLNNAVGFFIPQPMNSLEVGQAMERWHANFPQFKEELAKEGIHAIGFRPLENYGLLCTEPVRSLADLKGKRVRSYGFAFPALFEAIGATPVSIGTPETYEALQRSVIDCTPIGPVLARGWKFDEVAKYYVDVPIGAQFGHLLAMSLDSYNAMDDETRAVVDQLGHDYLIEYTRLLAEDTKRVLDLWNGELGVEVIPFPQDALTEAMQDARVQAVREEWKAKAAATGLPVEKVVDDLSY